MADTIAGVATAAGEGGVAIVRMSGDEAAFAPIDSGLLERE